MTRYTVVWVESAVAELADIWLAESDRHAVTLAAQSIEAELSHDADQRGLPLVEGLRALHLPPLRIVFSVRVADRLAEVLLVRRI